MRRRAQEVNAKQSAPVPDTSWLVRAYVWACERLYDQLAPAYDLVSWLVSFGQWRRWQTGVWRELRGHAVLELGCGTGAVLVTGTRQGKAMTGVDRSPRILAVAMQRISTSHSEAKLIQGDGNSLPLASHSFDSVVATFPASYILQAATLAEVRRVLPSGGCFVIAGLWVEVRAGQWRPRLPVFYGKPDDAALAQILQRLADAGFDAHWVEQRHGWFTVGTLVADRGMGQDDEQ
jgi:SAM-dependent methyltransferase